MRVLVYGFSGKILGGIETFILNMNDHMSSDTIFDYVIDGNECVYKERIGHKGGEIFFVPGVRRNPIKYVRTFWHTLGVQHKRGTSLFYVQLFSMANMLPVFLAKMRGYKVILHSHNNGLQSKSKVYEIIHLIGKFLSRHGNYIRFTNSLISSDFMFGKGINSEIIYNAIDIEKFSFHQDIRDRVRYEQCCNVDSVIGFVGRLTRQKNPVFMIKVFAEILKIKKGCELWIIGEGELKTDMMEKINSYGINNHIKWFGRRNDVELLMQGMDLLLQPSIFEGLGIVLVEAQATGLPVITSADVVPDEAKASILLRQIRLDTPASEWARECVNFIEERKGMSRNAKDVAFTSNFDIKLEARRLENMLTSYSYNN